MDQHMDLHIWFIQTILPSIFVAEAGEIMVLPLHKPPTLIFTDCCFVPRSISLVFPLFIFNLSVIIQALMSPIQLSMLFTASSAEVIQFGLNHRYNCVSSACAHVDGRWRLIMSNSLPAYMVESSSPRHEPCGTPHSEWNFSGWHNSIVTRCNLVVRCNTNVCV